MKTPLIELENPRKKRKMRRSKRKARKTRPSKTITRKTTMKKTSKKRYRKNPIMRKNDLMKNVYASAGFIGNNIASKIISKMIPSGEGIMQKITKGISRFLPALAVNFIGKKMIPYEVKEGMMISAMVGTLSDLAAATPLSEYINMGQDTGTQLRELDMLLAGEGIPADEQIEADDPTDLIEADMIEADDSTDLMSADMIEADDYDDIGEDEIIE